ncbi:MAG: phosphoglucosamine mutase [Gammaproteobacteria bacterium]
MKKYFGTDGIRGRVGEYPINPEFVMKLGWAAGRVLANNGNGPVLIGKDTRLSGYMFESALEAGLSAAGADVKLLGPVPTPGIAFLTKNTRAQAGIVISASHNPYYDNGIKFFSGEGQKLGDDIEEAIETELDKPLQVIKSGKLGKATRMVDAPRRYIEFCKGRFADNLNLNGMRIVLDCANGAAYHIAPKVFQELGASVETIGASPDGFNINDGYGATETARLQQLVVETRSDLGIALDGDGDRLIMVDHTGEVVDGDEILYILARDRKETLNGGVVGTLMSNLGLEHAIKGLGLEFYRARVGDRYVMEIMREKGLVLGGESSGHLINLHLTTTGDGIISALQVLEAMLNAKCSLAEIKSGMIKYPQKLMNVRLESRLDISAYPGITDLVSEAERQLGENGRVLLRASGTEPLIRVMVEGRDGDQVDILVQMLATEVENTIRK